MERVNATKKAILLTIVLLMMLTMLFTALYTQSGITAEASDDELYDLLGFGIYPKINEGNLTIDPEDALVNLPDYVSGICASGDLPVIILQLEGENMADYSNVTYYYRAQESIDEVAEGEVWTQIADDDGNNPDIYAELYLDDLINPGDYFRKYMFFKTVVNEAGVGDVGAVTQEYVNKAFVDVIVDRTMSDTAYAINSVSATYYDKGADLFYNTDNPSWVSTYVTFTLTSNSNTTDNTYFGYSYQTRFNETTQSTERIWLAASRRQNANGTWEGVAVIDETYEGEVLFSGSDLAHAKNQEYNSSRKFVKIDRAEPSFEITATMNGGADRYNYGSGTNTASNNWSATDVTYTLNPNGECISGAEYYYNVNNEYDNGVQVWNRIIPRLSGVTGKYIYSVVFSKSVTHLKFRGVSNAGKTYSDTTDYITNIDKETPVLNLVAQDANGTTVTSGGYASDQVTFSLSNDNAYNISTVSFQYKVSGDESWQTVGKSDNNYIFRASQPIVNRTYIFRAISRAGLYDEEVFVVSALDSNFTIKMDDPIFEVNAKGWAKDEIAIYLTLPTVLGIDEINAYCEEYDIYSAVYGDNTTEKEVVAILVDSFTENGVAYNKYKTYIDASLNGNIMTFYALNRARDKSAVLKTEAIKLDLENPVSTVQSRIYNSTVVLGEDDWANGRVIIEITPESNISGLSCYPLLGVSGSYVTGREMTFSNGMFSYSVTESGVYRFRLQSGAGRIQTPEIEVEVNIDTNDITFESLAVSVDGKVFDPTTTVISGDAVVSFVSNQAGHFNYYYQAFTGGAPLPNAYTLGEGETYTFSPNRDGNGSIKLSFYLESKAVGADGTRDVSKTREVTISYDVTEFELGISYPEGLSNWRNTPVDFYFTNTNSVTFKEIQMKLDGGDWEAIDYDTTNMTYTFGGVLQALSDGTVLGYAYNGGILFRAINTAGHPSSVVGSEITVKLDMTTPDPARAIQQAEGGETRYNSSENLYYVYSYKDIKYTQTSYESLAPITYYWKQYSSGETGFSNYDGFTKLTTENGGSLSTVLNGRVWLAAQNSLNVESGFTLYYFIVEDVAPSATLSGGTLNPNSGLYEFNWQDSITISILAESETPVYYWYKIGSGEWTLYSANAEAADGTVKDIIFLGQADANYPEAVVGNMDETVYFKITNLSGNTYEIDDRIRAKIDTDSPSFDVETSVLGEIIASTDRNKWYSDEIYIRLTPTSYNPGGVIYKYRTAGAGYNYERLPGDGTFFSTDDLITYSGNGEVTIYLLATARATGYEETFTLTLYVDKIYPEFDLIGEITVNDTANTKTIKSGEWAQADEVRITKSLKNTPVSTVTFTIASSLNPGADPDAWPDSSPTRVITTICVITVTTTNQAGLTVTKTFEVNIDNDAPVIDSGIIRNKMKQLADGTYVIDTENPYRYYIDQVITYVEPNLKSAKYNNFPLANGQIIATNTVDNSNGGYVHIVIEDMAGNKAELVFYMTIFDLTVNTITLADEDIALLESFENDYSNLKSTLTTSRQEYFAATISRLWDRIATLEKQVEDYQQYLLTINSRVAFDLKSDYEEMFTYINYFTTADTSILYPQWQQDMITTPANTYGAYYQKLLSEYAKLEALMSQVKDVQSKTEILPATNVVARSDYTAILRVYNAYNSLTVDQKSVFKATLYTKLTELKRSCEVLLLQDESTGIDISGDDLAAGVTIEVESYTKTSELVNNAQLTLLENYADGTARAIVTVSRIYLSGYGSQYDTGDIVITLPIPDAYQSYIKFAVYRLSSDGTVTPMEGVIINGDGKSVYFETDTLGTYILAANANTTVREQSEKIYGSIGDVEIDGTLLAYITYAACGLAGLLIIILIVVAIKKKWFLRAYDRAQRHHLAKRGMEYIPKGNDPARTNPAAPPERMDYNQRIYQNKNHRF